VLIGPWQRSDPRAFSRAAAFTTIGRQGGTPGGKVGRSATDIPRDPRRLDLGQRKAPIRDEHFVSGQERLGRLSQPSLPGGFSEFRRCWPYEPTGDGQALAPYRADTGGETQRDRGPGLACLRTVMLSRTPLETWPPATDQVTGNGTVAPMPMGLSLAVVLPHALPGGQE